MKFINVLSSSYDLYLSLLHYSRKAILACEKTPVKQGHL